MRPVAVARLAAMWLIVAPSNSEGQSILVDVLDAESRAPLQGALVSLESPGGGALRQALTDVRGKFLFTGIEAGPYSVRAELIGFDDRAVGVHVTLGETKQLTISLATRAIELERLTVSAEERCEVRPGTGLRVALAWEEARKALKAAQWTAERGVYEYRMQRYVRDVELETGLVVHQESSTSRAYLRTPYESRPAPDLIANGFVQRSPDRVGGDLYFAPDAAVMLSDEFLDSHCLQLDAVAPGGSAIGISFRPVRGRRVPDIAGTILLDSRSWELRGIEFRYEHLPTQTEIRGVGGTIEFRRLPNGTWIVPEWRIRMPWLEEVFGGDGRRVVYQRGIREEGGIVNVAKEPGGQVVLSAETATIEGEVVDELSGEPMAGAPVALEGTDFSGRTGPDGSFRFAEVLPGLYRVSLDPLSDTTAVQVEAGDYKVLRLLQSNPATFAARACGEEIGDLATGTAFVAGRVTERGTGMGLAQAQVVIAWEEHGFSASSDGRAIGSRGSGRAARVASGDGTKRTGGGAGTAMGWNYRLSTSGYELVAATDANGYYRACAVPTNLQLSVAASWGPFEADSASLRLSEGTRAHAHDIALTLSSPASLAGYVVGQPGGEAVSSAEVRLFPLGDARGGPLYTLVSDSEGRFALGEVEAGDYSVEVHRLGYGTAADSVRIVAGRSNHMTIEVPRTALAIEGLVVEVEPRLQRLEAMGFYARRRGGLGIHLDADQVSARLVTHTSQLLERSPGVQVRTVSGSAGSGTAVVVRGCLPAVYVDGTLVRRATAFVASPGPGDYQQYLDDLVNPGDIAGLEVYSSPAEVPVQYGGTGSQCGVVLVWSH